MQRSTWARSIAAEELNQRALRPSSIVAVGIGQKGAMASLRGFEVAYVWIAAQPGFGFGEDVNEGIVLGMNEQGRDADLLQAGGGAGAATGSGQGRDRIYAATSGAGSTGNTARKPSFPDGAGRQRKRPDPPPVK